LHSTILSGEPADVGRLSIPRRQSLRAMFTPYGSDAEAASDCRVN
jgi:hypothetical protein